MGFQYRSDPRRLRISDREREQIIEILGQAAGDGRLTLDEYAERSGQVYAARTRGELEEIVADLPVAFAEPPPIPVMPTVPVPPPPMVPAERVVAVFGNDSRRGRWVVPPLVQARAVFGECRVELHQALIYQPYIVIDALAVLGKVVVVVPEGIGVRLTGMAVFGKRQSRIRREPMPGAPVVEVRAHAVFGEVSVRPPRWWQAWRQQP
jgi:hypothetical protein